MKKKWKKVVGFNKYMISDTGEIKSFHKSPKGRTMSQSNDKDGYKKVTLTKDGKEYTRRVHRLVAEAFIENPDGHPVVNHINGKVDDNHVSNLEWTTVRKNTIHAYEIGLNKAVGHMHYEAKSYKVYHGGKLIGCFNTMSSLENSLKINRGTIADYISKKQLIYGELKVLEVDTLKCCESLLNIELITSHSKGCKKLADSVAILDKNKELLSVYPSLRHCSRVTGHSFNGMRDRLNDGKLYKRKYFIVPITQYKFIKTDIEKRNLKV